MYDRETTQRSQAKQGLCQDAHSGKMTVWMLLLFCPLKCDDQSEYISTTPVLPVRKHHYKSGCHTCCDRVRVQCVGPITITQSVLYLALCTTRGNCTLCHEYSFGPAAASLHPGIYTLHSALLLGSLNIFISVCLLHVLVTTCVLNHRMRMRMRMRFCEWVRAFLIEIVCVCVCVRVCVCSHECVQL